jgi:hypothetical protein
MASGLVLFTYITAHLVNHALGLISLNTAEEGLGYAEDVWDSLPGTALLYGAAAVHFVLALWAIYERRTSDCHRRSSCASRWVSRCRSFSSITLPIRGSPMRYSEFHWITPA